MFLQSMMLALLRWLLPKELDCQGYTFQLKDLTQPPDCDTTIAVYLYK